MSFFSASFGLFIVVVFVLYWWANERSVRQRNYLLILANVVFYCWWDWRSLPVLLFLVTGSYLLARWIGRTENLAGRQGLLFTGVLGCLAVLAYFKYSGFIHELLSPILGSGQGEAVGGSSGALPLGISFYTFTTIGYLIDVYRGRIAAARDYGAFVAFCSFFPNATAGPIERGATLLPQLLERSTFDLENAKDGARQFLWGALKKLVVADTLGGAVSVVFGNPAAMSGLELGAGALMYSAQIYFDFSGYSDMAIGLSRWFGIRLTRNFAYPYFARDVGEFWRRWHISLSSWFRDYVFFPLGANRYGRVRTLVNILVTFAACGLWHGAGWTFIVWGVVIGMCFLPLVLRAPDRRKPPVKVGGWARTSGEMARIVLTFTVITLAWVIFRSTDLHGASVFLRGLVEHSWTGMPHSAQLAARAGGLLRLYFALALTAGVLCAEWFQADQPHGLAIASQPRWLRWCLYYVLLVLLAVSWGGESTRFIYANF